jgi:uncharacterized protein with gpF-like domain
MKEKNEPQLKVLESKHIALDYDQELKQLWVELLRRHTDSVVLSKGETHAFSSEQNQEVLNHRRGR